jgi:hypothetical protein
MEDKFEIKFLDGDQIEVSEKGSGDSAVFQYYDDDPDLYLVSFHYRSVGMPFSQLQDFFDAAEEELTVQRYLGEGEATPGRLQRDLEEFHQLAADFQKKSQADVFEFFHDRDVKVLSESPADFFLPLDMDKMLPDEENDFTGAQFFQTATDAEKQIPAALRKQVEALCKTKYSFRAGYPILLLEAPRDEDAQNRLLLFPETPSGILFIDRTHLYGIIQFSGLKQYFATDWNRQRPRFPQLYCNESGKILLVKKYALNEKDEIADPNSQEWYSFFNIGPTLVIRQYQEFKRNAESVRRHR